MQLAQRVHDYMFLPRLPFINSPSEAQSLKPSVTHSLVNDPPGTGRPRATWWPCPLRRPSSHPRPPWRWGSMRTLRPRLSSQSPGGAIR